MAVRSRKVVAMSMSVRKPSVDRGIELDSVVNWPAVAVSIGWGLLVLGVPLALTLFALLRPAPEDETPAHQWQALAWHLPAPSAPRPPRAPAPDVVTTATPPTPAVPEVQPKRSPTTTPSAPVRTSGPLVAQRPAPTPAPAPTPKAEPVKEVKQVVASFRRMHGYQESQL